MLDLGGAVELLRTSTVPTSRTSRGRRSRRPGCAADPRTSPVDVFGAIRAGDILVHHPYESFATSVEGSSRRPPTTRRCWPSSRRSTAPPATRPIVRDLIRRGRARQAGRRARRAQGALRRGGQHRLGARARSGRRARGVRHRRPEDALQDGARRAATSGGGLRRYVHIGTGNYNAEDRAQVYEDLGLLTCRRRARRRRQANCSTSSPATPARRRYRRLLVAPAHAAPGLLELIDARDRARPTPARRRGIVIKMNAIVDPALIDALYRARRAPASRSTSSCAASARSGRACPASRSASACARSSVGSSSTRASSASAVTARGRSTSARPT